MKESKNPICCICGNECEDKFGNNPFPLVKEADAVCCNKCNLEKVIPARLYKLYNHEYNHDYNLLVSSHNIDDQITDKEKREDLVEKIIHYGVKLAKFDLSLDWNDIEHSANDSIIIYLYHRRYYGLHYINGELIQIF